MIARYHQTPYGYDACLDENCQFPFHYAIVEDQGPTGESINKRYQLIGPKSGEFRITPEMFCKTLQGELDNVTDNLSNIEYHVKDANRRIDKIAEQISWLSTSLRNIKID